MQLSLVKQFPLLRVVIPLVLGIWVSEKLCCFNILFVILFLSFLSWIALVFYFFKHTTYRLRYLTGLLFAIFVLLFGVVWFHVRTTTLVNSSSFIGINGYISSVEGETDRSYKYKIISQTLTTDSIIVNEQLTGLLYLSKDSDFKSLNPGEHVYILGKLIPFAEPANPNAFNYSKYLERAGVSFRVWTTVEKVKRLDVPPAVTVAVFTGKLRDRITLFYEKNGLRGEELSVLKAMFLGDRSDLLPEDKRSFSYAGVIHLLAVSGLHLGIIYLMLLFLLKPLSGRKLKNYRVAIVLIVLWSYAMITGLSPSVFRSAIMFSLVEIGTLLKRHSSVFHQLLASIVIIVLIEPYSIYKAGFWLSHAAVASIVYFYPKINTILNFRFVFFRWIWSLISVSVAAQIGTFVLSIYYFNMFPVYFIIGNILLVPLMAPVLMLASVSAILSLMPFLNFAEIFVQPINDLIGFMIDVTHFTGELPGAVISNISISNIELVLFGMIFLSVLLFNYENRKIAIFMALISAVLLGVSFTGAKVKRLGDEALVIYSQRRLGFFNKLSNNENKVYLSDSLTAIKMGYICGGYWAKHNAMAPEIRVLDENSSNAILFKIDTLRVLLLYKINKLPSLKFKPKVDFVLLAGSPRISVYEIVNSVSFKEIVVSSDNKPWVTKRLSAEAKKQDVLLYDVIKQGAWVCETEH